MVCDRFGCCVPSLWSHPPPISSSRSPRPPRQLSHFTYTFVLIAIYVGGGTLLWGLYVPDWNGAEAFYFSVRVCVVVVVVVVVTGGSGGTLCVCGVDCW